MLALWMDFWDWDGSPASVSATSDIVLSPYTTGNARGNLRADNTYQMLPDDYWDARESTLRQDPPKPDVTLPPEDKTTAAPPPPKSDTGRESLLAEFRNAPDLDTMKSLAAKLRAGA